MEKPTKEFLFNFQGGGFNTVMAKTLPGAKKKVMQEWGSHKSLTPLVETVRLVSQKELNSWYRLSD
jgi:hypothetical protein